jgi:hypothetical protein
MGAAENGQEKTRSWRVIEGGYKMVNDITFEMDTSAVDALVGELLKHLPDSPRHVREFALNLLDGGGELFSIEQGVAAGAVVSLLLKPTQRLLDFSLAVRTGDFDRLVVKDSHDSSIVDGL